MKDASELLKKIEQARKGSADLSLDEDLSIAIMNLISLEEHLYYTAVKTSDAKYLDLLDSIRETRKELLKKIVKNPKGEEWCISKHLLAASMRLMEVGTKELNKKNKNEAWNYFTKSFELYSLFFAINLGMIEQKELTEEKKKEYGFMQKFSQTIKHVIDCCKE